MEQETAQQSAEPSVAGAMLGAQGEAPAAQAVTPAVQGNVPAQQNQQEPPAQQPDGLVLPADGANPEEWDAFYTKLGRPGKAEDYRIELPEGDSGEMAKAMAPVFHQMGLNQRQVDGLAKGWNAFAAQAQEQFKAQEAQQAKEQEAAALVKNQAEADALKKEWGENHTANTELAARAVRQFIPKEHATAVISALEKTIGTKATITMLHGIGKGLAEDSAAGLEGRGKATSQTLAQVLYGGTNS